MCGVAEALLERESGIESYVAVLTSQQDLYAAQQQLIEVRFERLVNLADLYRALGGGWLENSRTER